MIKSVLENHIIFIYVYLLVAVHCLWQSLE